MWWGPVRHIVRTEIASREYVTFDRQPEPFFIRMTGGRLAGNDRRTKQFGECARSHAIAVTTP